MFVKLFGKNSIQDTAQDIELYLRSNNEQKVKGLTRDVLGKPLINLDLRHKTSGADNRSCLVLLIAFNFRIQCRMWCGSTKCYNVI